MKIPYFFILTVCATASNVYADPPRLPPVLDNSTYNESTPAAPSSQAQPSYEDNSGLEKLQNDISELKNRVKEQDDVITHLKRTNTDLQKKLGGSKAVDIDDNKAPTLDASPAKAAAPKSATGAETEKEHYQHGSALLKKGDYAGAIAEFKGFIAAYPTSKHADNAQYWIAVALLNKGDKKAAIQAFDRVPRAYPQSEKTPDALFKLGDTLLSLKNKTKAKEYFDYVIQNYPGTDGAKLAAKKKASAKL